MFHVIRDLNNLIQHIEDFYILDDESLLNFKNVPTLAGFVAF